MNNDANFRNLSCQLGGLTLNGNVSQGTASNVSILTINDPAVLQDSSGMKKIKINFNNNYGKKK
jgi:hypothetical protein